MKGGDCWSDTFLLQDYFSNSQFADSLTPEITFTLSQFCTCFKIVNCSDGFFKWPTAPVWDWWMDPALMDGSSITDCCMKLMNGSISDRIQAPADDLWFAPRFLWLLHLEKTNGQLLVWCLALHLVVLMFVRQRLSCFRCWTEVETRVTLICQEESWNRSDLSFLLWKFLAGQLGDKKWHYSYPITLLQSAPCHFHFPLPLPWIYPAEKYFKSSTR